MFTATRYITSGIAEEVGLDLQILLWSLIDIWKKEYKDTIDYLQVFELEVVESGTPNIRVTHRQEVPPREEEHYFRVSTPLEASTPFYKYVTTRILYTYNNIRNYCYVISIYKIYIYFINIIPNT